MKKMCLAFALVLLSADRVVIGAMPPELTPRQKESAKLQLQGMKDSRDRLVSGTFKATGRKQVLTSSGSFVMNDPVKYFCSFDYPAGLLRFDRDMPVVRLDPATQKSPVIDREKGIYIRTPKHSFCWTSEQPDTLFRASSSAKPAPPATPFDVRSLGLAFDLDRNVTFAQQYRMASEAKLVEVAEEAKGIYRTVWEMQDPGTFVTVWFDEQQGHSPIRTEVRVGELGNLPANPLQRAETTWVNISGIWVPKTFLSKYFDNKGKLESKMELAFEWESVNQPVPEKVFTAAGTGLPPETPIVSYGRGKRISLGTIGDGQRESISAARPRTKLAFLAAGTALLIIVVIVFVLIARRPSAVFHGCRRDDQDRV